MASNLTIGQPFNTEIIQAALHVVFQASPEDKPRESHPWVDRGYTPHGARGYYYIWRSIKKGKNVEYVMFTPGGQHGWVE